MDTICAISTARAAAAVGIVRVSGADAISICDSIIRLKSGTLQSAKTATMRLGTVYDGDIRVDEVLCAVFRAPASYTGEDIVEINCHGGLLILDRVMKLLISHGARSAQGGEFTKRAFLNGKMDLVQAEAVGDLISAVSSADASLALGRMSGGLSREFGDIFDRLVALGADILAYIDFPDEGLSDVSSETVLKTLSDIEDRLCRMEKSFDSGSVIHDGADTVIVGAPNVGKSTLLNAILGYERALVSDVAGTTRDIVSERVSLGGVTLNLCDTAGMREQAEQLEKRGIELALRSLEDADLVLALFDGSRALSADDEAMIARCGGKTAIAVVNKCDLPRRIDSARIEKAFSRCVYISASQGDGLEQLSKEVSGLFLADKLSIESGMLVANTRHYERVVAALRSVRAAAETVKNGFTPDLASLDITAAASEIGMITGAGVSDRIIDEIFSKFCVGK